MAKTQSVPFVCLYLEGVDYLGAGIGTINQWKQETFNNFAFGIIPNISSNYVLCFNLNFSTTSFWGNWKWFIKLCIVILHELFHNCALGIFASVPSSYML